MNAKAATKKRVQFLRALQSGSTVSEAVKLADVDRKTVYRWRDQDDVFRKSWERCIDRGTTVLEDIALERAKDKSDTLLIFLLKSRRPDIYAERKVVTGDVKHTHSGQIGVSQSADWLADVLRDREERPPTEPVH